MRITRKFEIDAGHRIHGHGGKCRHVHGHRYVIELTVRADELDSLGMVVDFGRLKDGFGEFLNSRYDHKLILSTDDPLHELIHTSPAAGYSAFGIGSVVWVPVPPTAENLARMMFDDALAYMPDGVTLCSVRVYETPNCWADYCPKEDS